MEKFSLLLESCYKKSTEKTLDELIRGEVMKLLLSKLDVNKSMVNESFISAVSKLFEMYRIWNDSMY